MDTALFNNKPLIETLTMQSVKHLQTIRREERERYLQVMWDFYHGRHSDYFRRLEAEDDAKYAKRRQRAFTDNLCRAVVDKSVSYLYGKGERIVRRFKDQTASEFMSDVYRFNDMDNFMINVSTMGGVEGNALVKHVFVDSRTGFPFSAEVNPADIKKYGIIKFIRFSGLTYTPVYPASDFTALTGIILHYWEDNYTGIDEVEQFLNKKYESKEVIEYTTDTEWYRWTRTSKQTKWIQEQIFPKTDYQNKNPYGKLSVVYTEFENLPSPDTHEGVGDLDDIVGLNLHLDERRTDEIFTIIHHIYPILKVIGAEFNEFVRTAKSVIQLPMGASADYLTWDNKIEASLRISEKLERSISRNSSIPAISWGELGDIGNLRSGAALRVAFAPAIEKTQRKQKTYGRGERQMAEAALSMYEFHTGEKFETKNMDLEYPQDYVPTDELNDAQIMALLITSGVLLRQDVVAKLYPHLTEPEIKAKLADILIELEKFKEATKKVPEFPTRTSEVKQIEQE